MSKIDEPNKEFNFIKSLSDFYNGIVLKFKDNDESKINDDICTSIDSETTFVSRAT